MIPGPARTRLSSRVLSNARILTFDADQRVINCGSVEIRGDGTIGSVSERVAAGGVDVHGKLLMPALINCHTHLYSTLARGISFTLPAAGGFAAGQTTKNDGLPYGGGDGDGDFVEILRGLWWRLDRALNPRDVYYSALVGLIDSAKCGVGTLVDHHSSPNACAGSLDVIEQAFREVGLRGVLCYETSDRNGAKPGIAENIRFIERAQKMRDGLVSASFGLHAAFTLSDRTLRQCVEANQSLGTGFHVHVAEDRSDAGAARRLCDGGILDERSIAAHCVHVTAGEMKTLARRGVNVVHNPQSNCNNAVGVQKLLELVRRGVLVGLGSDGYSPRMWDEFKTAFHLQKVQARDPRAGYAEAYAAAFLNNREIVRKAWGLDVGRIETGAKADLVLVDYLPPTPLTAGNLFGHLLFGISNAPVDSLMVNGKYVLRNGRIVTVDERAIREKAGLQTRKLWRRFETLK